MIEEGPIGGTLTIVSFNVNGIRSVLQGKKGGLKEVFRSLGNPDIVCLQETKLSTSVEGIREKKDISHTLDKGYESFWNVSSARAGYAGVAILLREGLACAVHDWFTVEPVCVCDQCALLKKEGRVLQLEMGSSNLVLITVYVPNGGKEHAADPKSELPLKTEFLRLLRAQCDAWHRAGRQCVVVGDLNIVNDALDIYYDISQYKQSFQAGHPCINAKVAAWFQGWQRDGGMVDSFRALHPGVRKYSWWDLKSGARAEGRGWRLDYCMVSASLMDRCQASDILESVHGSDHCPVRVTLRDFVPPGDVPSKPLPLSSRCWPRQTSVLGFFAKKPPSESAEKKRSLSDASEGERKKKSNNEEGDDDGGDA